MVYNLVLAAASLHDSAGGGLYLWICDQFWSCKCYCYYSLLFYSICIKYTIWISSQNYNGFISCIACNAYLALNFVRQLIYELYSIFKIPLILLNYYICIYIGKFCSTNLSIMTVPMDWVWVLTRSFAGTRHFIRSVSLSLVHLLASWNSRRLHSTFSLFCRFIFASFISKNAVMAIRSILKF